MYQPHTLTLTHRLSPGLPRRFRARLRFGRTNRGAYNTYLQCLKKEGTDEACATTKWQMKGVCPWQWQEKWLEQREGGFFPGVEGAPIPKVEGDGEEDY